mgnify:CR=1 FL=1
MIVGFNTDIKYRNEVFHIQTEDKGANNPLIETLVYVWKRGALDWNLPRRRRYLPSARVEGRKAA